MEEEIIKRLEMLEKKVAELEGASIIPKKETRETSLKEFLLSKELKSDIQKTRLIAYYLETFSNFASFTSEEIVEGYRTAKESVPKNVPDNIAKNVGMGYMMVAKEKKGNKKAWTLTNSGINEVESNLEK